MIAIAHFIAISCYIAAAALAALPFARSVRAPVAGVIALLAAGALIHFVGLAALAMRAGSASRTGLSPALYVPGMES